MSTKNGPFQDLAMTQTVKRAVAALTTAEVRPMREAMESIDESLTRVNDVAISATLDTNAPNAKTPLVNVSGTESVGIEVVAETGTHGTHQIQVRAKVKEDGTTTKVVANEPLNVFLGGSLDRRLLGVSQLLQLDVRGYSDLEFKVVIAEGAASTVTVHVRRWK